MFFPVPGTPAVIPKPFPMWGIPFMFPMGLTYKFSFYFGDQGGCLFVGGPSAALGEEAHMASSGPRWVMAIPVAVKLVVPSWLFIMIDLSVGGNSVMPCMTGVCKATVHSGQFSITGPVLPMMKLLEAAAAPKTCEFVEKLPDVTFNLMGMSFTMTWQDYVIYGNQYGQKECLSAFSPDAQLIPGFDVWVLGDAFIRAFYSVFEVHGGGRGDWGPGEVGAAPSP